jgi:ribosome biogenesis protein NSA1
MPRTTTLECPGCPPLRALTFDTLGLIKGTFLSFSYFIPFLFAYHFFSYSFLFLLIVIESREKQGGPKVVERWGDPDSTKSVNAVSLIDRKSNPVRSLFAKTVSLLL